MKNKPKEKKVHKEKLYPQDKILAKTILKLIPVFILPSYLSVLRILLTPFAAWYIAYGTHLWLALLIYLSVSFTDMVDGALARTRNQVTDFGKVLDPIADKLLFILSCILLMPKFGYENLMFLLIFTEALTIALGYIFFRKKSNNMAANIFGKAKLNCQIAGILLFIIANYVQNNLYVKLGAGALFISVILHALSVIYFLNKSNSKN